MCPKNAVSTFWLQTPTRFLANKTENNNPMCLTFFLAGLAKNKSTSLRGSRGESSTIMADALMRRVYLKEVEEIVQETYMEVAAQKYASY